MELKAAVMGAELAAHVGEAVDFAAVQLWSYSTTVLAWIKNPDLRLKQYVGNRVQRICALTSPSAWS